MQIWTYTEQKSNSSIAQHHDRGRPYWVRLLVPHPSFAWIGQLSTTTAVLSFMIYQIGVELECRVHKDPDLQYGIWC